MLLLTDWRMSHQKKILPLFPYTNWVILHLEGSVTGANMAATSLG